MKKKFITAALLVTILTAGSNMQVQLTPVAPSDTVGLCQEEDYPMFPVIVHQVTNLE